MQKTTRVSMCLKPKIELLKHLKPKLFVFDHGVFLLLVVAVSLLIDFYIKMFHITAMMK